MNIFKLKIAFLTIVAAFLSCAELNAQSNTFTSLIEKIHPESYETLTEQATARKKNYILCSTYASSDKRNKPCFADSRMARVTFLPFSREVYSSKMPMICRIRACEGSSPVGWVTETTSTPAFLSLRIVISISAPLR